MNKNKAAFTAIAALLISAVMCLCACKSSSPNELKYWFSDYRPGVFVPYDKNANNGTGNRDVAGTYWEFTVANDCSVTITFRAESEFSSSSALYVNGAESERSDYDPATGDIFTLSLKKGDKLKYRVYWMFGNPNDTKPFKMLLMTISDGEKTYSLIDNSDN